MDIVYTRTSVRMLMDQLISEIVNIYTPTRQLHVLTVFSIKEYVHMEDDVIMSILVKRCVDLAQIKEHHILIINMKLPSFGIFKISYFPWVSLSNFFPD